MAPILVSSNTIPIEDVAASNVNVHQFGPPTWLINAEGTLIASIATDSDLGALPVGLAIFRKPTFDEAHRVCEPWTPLN